MCGILHIPVQNSTSAPLSVFPNIQLTWTLAVSSSMDRFPGVRQEPLALAALPGWCCTWTASWAALRYIPGRPECSRRHFHSSNICQRRMSGYFVVVVSIFSSSVQFKWTNVNLICEAYSKHNITNHSLYRVLRPADVGAQEPVHDYHNPGCSPSKHNQPLDELFLRDERRHEHRMQIKSFAQHPGVVGEQKVMQHQVQTNAGSLRCEHSIRMGG